MTTEPTVDRLYPMATHIEYLPIDNLVPFSRNARVHSARHVLLTAGSDTVQVLECYLGEDHAN